MRLSRLTGWWRDLSVSKKLYSVVGLMAVLIATELIVLILAMDVLSAVRGFVAGEGLWSKAQKNAILEIQNYVIFKDQKHLDNFQNYLKISYGDRQARLEMAKKDMDLALVTAGFLQGGNHPQDIPGMISLIRRFHKVDHLAAALEAWTAADALMESFVSYADQIHTIVSHTDDPQNISQQKTFLTEINKINAELTRLEDLFSYKLGEASRWLEGTLLLILLLVVLTIESTGLFLTFRFSQNLSSYLTELNLAATKIGQGDFAHRVPVRSKDDLGQLAGSLNQMTNALQEMTGERNQAEEANQIKSLFLANMSHEIRTPIGAILGFIELLREPDIGDKEKRQYLDIISRTGEALVTIINDILDISKVEAGKLEISAEAFSLKQLLKDLHLLLKLRSDDKGIHLNFIAKDAVPEFIRTDPLRLRQILLNIIGNAIKFTRVGSVDVTYWVTDHYLHFAVKDSGPGIPPEVQNRLFTPFTQGDLSIRKAHGGTGLGLTLSRKLARLLNGDVRLEESRVGFGSTFLVRVAIEPATASNKPAQARPNTENPLHGLRILLVEDAPENQILVSHLLTRSGATVQIAQNGQEALDRIAQDSFEVILMDMQMPILDGYSATVKLRTQGYTKPIIALTAHAMKDDINRCYEAGCNDVLTKPVKRHTLVESILQNTRISK